MNLKENYPRALSPPSDKVVIINNQIIKKAVNSSRKSPRRRIILPFHKLPSDTLHRMLNALQPMSYIQPHRHFDPPKAESIIVLQGAILYIAFNKTGGIANFYKLSAGSPNVGIDTEPGIYHTFFALVEDTVLFEVKPGPYEHSSDKDFASWAPAEDLEAATEYMRTLLELTDKV